MAGERPRSLTALCSGISGVGVLVGPIRVVGPTIDYSVLKKVSKILVLTYNIISLFKIIGVISE